MKNYLLIPAVLLFTSCNAGTTEGDKTKATEDFAASYVAEDTLADAIFEEAAKEKEKTPAPDTTCYVLTEGEGNRNVNASSGRPRSSPAVMSIDDHAAPHIATTFSSPDSLSLVSHRI